MTERQRTTLEVYLRCGQNGAAAARVLGVTKDGINTMMRRLRQRGEFPDVDGRARDFDVAPVPDPTLDAQELLASRKTKFARRHAAEKAKELVDVTVNVDGPIGIVHFGDPHVDDDGCDIVSLERHVELIKATDGLFGATVGDLHNNWVGRLAHCYGKQSTSEQEAWVLIEWLMRAIDWLYVVGGNHDCWRDGDRLLAWMAELANTHFQPHGTRLALQFPNKKEVRINARHDFRGHSQYNITHGPAKAAQMGWRDHLLTCGHTHASGYQVLKCPATGIISHALRIAGYKIHDSYADEKGFPNANVAPSVLTVIDPQYADDDPRLVTVLLSVEEGVEYLKWKRGCKRGKR